MTNSEQQEPSKSKTADAVNENIKESTFKLIQHQDITSNMVPREWENEKMEFEILERESYEMATSSNKFYGF